MAENQMLEIATDTMINLYNLDETEYAMFKFSEGAKNIQIGMTNGEVPLVATFPREFLRWQEMMKWNDSKKEDYIRHHMMNGMEIPEIVEANWGHIIAIVEKNPNGRILSEDELRELEFEDGSLTAKDAVVEEEADSELNTPVEEVLTEEDAKIADAAEVQVEEAEETAEDFEAKVEGKPKKPKKKLGAKKKK